MGQSCRDGDEHALEHADPDHADRCDQSKGKLVPVDPGEADEALAIEKVERRRDQDRAQRRFGKQGEITGEQRHRDGDGDRRDDANQGRASAGGERDRRARVRRR